MQCRRRHRSCNPSHKTFDSLTCRKGMAAHRGASLALNWSARMLCSRQRRCLNLLYASLNCAHGSIDKCIQTNVPLPRYPDTR